MVIHSIICNDTDHLFGSNTYKHKNVLATTQKQPFPPFSLSLQIKEIKWADVGGWTGQGGSLLGTKR